MSETLQPTPGQTAGPFFGYALPYDRSEHLAPPGHPEAVQLWGTVRDGAGLPVPDAMVEIWQADGDGEVVRRGGSIQRDGHTFTGFGRAATDNNGYYSFTTRVPGTLDEGRPRFIAVVVFARGLLNRLFTRAYLPEDAEYFPADPLLAGLDAERRDTLVMRGDDNRYRFDIILQGTDETVFLHFPRHPSK